MEQSRPAETDDADIGFHRFSSQTVFAFSHVCFLGKGQEVTDNHCLAGRSSPVQQTVNRLNDGPCAHAPHHD